MDTRPSAKARALAVAFVAALGAASAAAQDVPDDVVIHLERTSCFGPCPIYAVTIDARGNVTYDGMDNVRVKGRQADRIPVARVHELLQAADAIDFFNLRDSYRTIHTPQGELSVTDLPTTFVTITRQARTKRVEDYVGAPEGLARLEKQIDAAANTLRWVRIDVPTLQELVRNGWSPSVNERSELLRNALEHDDVEVVRGLLDIGADANGHDRGGNTPLMFVRSAGAAQALIDAGADPSAGNDNGSNPLEHAVYLAPAVTDVLLRAGVRPDQPVDESGRTALWHAACRGNIGVVRLLLNAGANPAVRWDGLSALECARRGGEAARTRPDPFAGQEPYTEDFDGTMALLAQALAKRKD